MLVPFFIGFPGHFIECEVSRDHGQNEAQRFGRKTTSDFGKLEETTTSARGKITGLQSRCVTAFQERPHHVREATTIGFATGGNTEGVEPEVD